MCAPGDGHFGTLQFVLVAVAGAAPDSLSLFAILLGWFIKYRNDRILRIPRNECGKKDDVDVSGTRINKQVYSLAQFVYRAQWPFDTPTVFSIHM